MMSRLPASVLLWFIVAPLLVACGGGGSGGSQVTLPVSSQPEAPPATALPITDALPDALAVNVAPGDQALRLAHPGFTDLDLSFTSGCTALQTKTIRRSLPPLSTDADYDELVDHRFNCGTAANTTYALTGTGRRQSIDYIVEHEFSTANEVGASLVPEETVILPRAALNDVFNAYVNGALPDDLNVLESLALSLIEDLAESNWSDLTNPEALYDTRATRVSYTSSQPDGSADAQLTGLVVTPVLETAVNFSKRDQMLVLSHATGSTPSELNLADAWFLLANLFASRGYLVVAPDNYGRGGTVTQSETYLMSYRTAVNSMDLIEQVLADASFDDVYGGSEISIIGYSQGGHSAFGLFELLTASPSIGVSVNAVYAGGGPHNLYRTVEGVLLHLQGSCTNDPYCRLVDPEVLVPFATDRILPGLLDYTEPGLTLESLITADTLSADFVSGFLNDETAYDQLKLHLQLNSFTAINNASDTYGEATTQIHLYHSEFDRLVPYANTDDLFKVLENQVNVEFHRGECNADGYELLFNLTDTVGVLHTLCGISVLDEVFAQLK